MSRIPINIDSTTYYLASKVWEQENKWRKHQERKIHKNMVEFFNKIHNETNTSREL